MFTKKKSDFAYVFNFPKPRKLAVTMFCVFYPIDIIFLNSENLVVELVSGLKPFRNYIAKNKVGTFVEFPKGFIEKFGLKVGQKINWNSKQVQII